MCLHVLLSRLKTAACLKDKWHNMKKNLKFNILNFMVWSLISSSIQSGKPLGTGREKWLLIGRNFMYLMIFHFDFFKVQSTSTQVSLSGQGGHTSNQVCRTAHWLAWDCTQQCFLLSWGKSQLWEGFRALWRTCSQVLLCWVLGYFRCLDLVSFMLREKKRIRNKTPNLRLQGDSSALLFGVTDMQWGGPRPRSPLGNENIMRENMCRLH